MSFRSMFQDVREAMDHVHLSVGAMGRGLLVVGAESAGVFPYAHPGRFWPAAPIPSAGLPQGEDTREPGKICGEGCESYRPLWTLPTLVLAVNSLCSPPCASPH